MSKSSLEIETCPWCKRPSNISLFGWLGPSAGAYDIGSSLIWGNTNPTQGEAIGLPSNVALLCDLWGECDICDVDFLVPAVVFRGRVQGILSTHTRACFGPSGSPPEVQIALPRFRSDARGLLTPPVLVGDPNIRRVSFESQAQGIEASLFEDTLPCPLCNEDASLWSWLEPIENTPLRLGSKVAWAMPSWLPPALDDEPRGWGARNAQEAMPAYVACNTCEEDFFIPLHRVDNRILGPMLRAWRPGVSKLLRSESWLPLRVAPQPES